MPSSVPSLDDEQLVAALSSMAVRNSLEDLHAGQGPITDSLMKELNRRVRDGVYTCLHALKWQRRSVSARRWVDYHRRSIPAYWEPPALLPSYRDNLEPEIDGAHPALRDEASAEYREALGVVRSMLDRIARRARGRSLTGPLGAGRRRRLDRYAFDRLLKTPKAERQSPSYIAYLEFDLADRATAMRGRESNAPVSPLAGTSTRRPT